MAMIKYRNEDLAPLLRARNFQAFAHGCNCQNVMGAGVARLVRSFLPEAWKADLATVKGDRTKLGTAGIVELPGGKLVGNLYTQYDYRGPRLRVDYEAVCTALAAFAAAMTARGLDDLVIPKIGAGLAGGDWSIIEGIVRESVPDNIHVTVYYL